MVPVAAAAAMVKEMQHRAEEQEQEGQCTEQVHAVFRDQEKPCDEQETTEGQPTGAAPPRPLRRFVHWIILQPSWDLPRA